jgi:uncharacterized protein (DUF2141 family)
MFCLNNSEAGRLARLGLAGVLWFSILLSSPSHAETHGSGGVIEFRTRLRDQGGVVRCGLFRKASWLKSPLATATARADRATALCVFEKIPPGVYALSAFHDKNNNGKLDTNLLSIPTEDYGASNNARGTFGPPSFEDAKFAYRGGTVRLEAVLR